LKQSVSDGVAAFWLTFNMEWSFFMQGIIRKMDHTGDSVLATFDTSNQESIEVAQGELTKFLDDCVSRFGNKPPVWGRRIGEKGMDMIDPSNISQCEEVVCQFPLVGG